LKQAPRQWHAKIDGFLVGVLGFSRNVSDECLYVRIQGGIIAITGQVHPVDGAEMG
jgi:hypothetical protein